MNGCVIGYGTVGKATARTFDLIKYHSRSKSNITLEEASKCEWIFICLPTPVSLKGEYETDDIISIIEKLSEYPEIQKANIVIRSTVSPGFNRLLQERFKLNFISNPEFLSEDTWEKDALRPDIVVAGADTPELREKIKGIYMGRFKYNEPFITDSVTAEFMKLALNGFFVTKVIYANLIYEFAQKIGANYEAVRFILGNHPNGSKNHFQIVHKGGRGAGGKCLQKDFYALAHLTEDSILLTMSRFNDYLLTKYPKKK